jgi:hypothetical protein
MNSTTITSPGGLTGSGIEDAQVTDAHVDPTTSPEEMSGADRDRHRARLERKQQKTAPTRALPTDDPSQWVGKKVRSKKTGATYVIRQVYKSNRVELEKSWMTYSSDVPAIRAEYEICV